MRAWTALADPITRRDTPCKAHPLHQNDTVSLSRCFMQMAFSGVHSQWAALLFLVTRFSCMYAITLLTGGFRTVLVRHWVHLCDKQKTSLYTHTRPLVKFRYIIHQPHRNNQRLRITKGSSSQSFFGQATRHTEAPTDDESYSLFPKRASYIASGAHQNNKLTRHTRRCTQPK